MAGAAGADVTARAGDDGPEPVEPPPVDRDWFGYPLSPDRVPVPCPTCGASFTTAAEFEAHRRSAHGDARPRGRQVPRGEAPALGRNRRSPLARRLRSVPLVLVVVVNVAAVVALLGALAAVGPPWWDELVAQPWSWAVIIPLLWPTLAFLALRGVD